MPQEATLQTARLLLLLQFLVLALTLWQTITRWLSRKRTSASARDRDSDMNEFYAAVNSVPPQVL